MTRVIGVLNYKGGTGKTTTVVNLAAGLALRGARVLTVDLDAQGGLASYMDVQYTYSLADLLLEQARPYACIVRARDNLDLIPGDRNLLQAEGYLWRIGDVQRARKRLAEKMRGVEGYDYVFLDFSPSASLLGESGLSYAQEVIVPVGMNYLALVGVRQVVEMIQSLSQEIGHRLHLSLIVPTFYDDRQRLDREIVAVLNRYFSGRIADPIRINVRLAEATGHGMTIYEYDPRSAGAVDYARLVERIANSGT